MASLLAARSSTARLARPTHVRAVQPRVNSRFVAPRRMVISHAAVNKEQVLESIVVIIAKQLAIDDPSTVTAESKFVDLGADSLDTVEIMMALEEKFDIELDEEGAEKITTVQQAADLISGQIAAK